MKPHLSLNIFISIFIFGCGLQNKELPPDIEVTACYNTGASLGPKSNRLQMVEIIKGDSTVFEYIWYKNANQEIVNGDTVTTPDTDFYERVSFVIKSNIDTFTITADSLKYLNGYYEFHGGESPNANTDFKIKTGFIKGYKQNDKWIVEASISVSDRVKTDSIIQQIMFKEVFTKCN